jgi:prepilin-type N-terminal cleavage/methylation domain-containing protein
MSRATKYQCPEVPRFQDGFTLLEVLVAIVILTTGLLGTAGLTTGVIRGNHYSKNVTSATAVAQTKLETIKSGGYSYATTANFPSDTVSMGGTTFTRATTIASSSPAANMKTVSVTVSWTESNNTGRSINLQTILAE